MTRQEKEELLENFLDTLLEEGEQMPNAIKNFLDREDLFNLRLEEERGQEASIQSRICDNCGEKFHLAEDCPNPAL